MAQIGYLFLMFPLAFSAASARLESGGALAGGLLQTISHASPKAAKFMSAGLIYAALGHDRIAGLAGIGRVPHGSTDVVDSLVDAAVDNLFLKVRKKRSATPLVSGSPTKAKAQLENA